MLPYLLNLLYLLALLAASPWLLFQAATKGKYRAGLAARLLGRVPHRTGTQSCVWLHAVSVGEVNLLDPLLAELGNRFPDCEFVVSTTTKTGYALACRKYSEKRVFYAPLDFTWAVNAAMRRVRPKLLILVELELWPNLIRAARRAGAAVAIVNGRLSERSFRGYQRLGRWIVPIIQQVDLIAVQSREYADRFCELGASDAGVYVTGSIKFDGAQSDRDNLLTRQLTALAGFQSEDIVFLAGSTQEPEEALCLQTYCTLSQQYPSLRLVLVPRHPERFEAVARLLDQSGLKWQRRTLLQHGLPSTEQPRILLVDSIGELAGWWGATHVAFVGGSLGTRGGQNMIEPAAYGAAVCFGPNTGNFKEIVAALLRAEAAAVVHQVSELTAFVQQALEDPARAAALGQRAAAIVKAHQGAASRTVHLLEPFLAQEVIMCANSLKAA